MRDSRAVFRRDLQDPKLRGLLFLLLSANAGASFVTGNWSAFCANIVALLLLGGAKEAPDA